VGRAGRAGRAHNVPSSLLRHCDCKPFLSCRLRLDDTSEHSLVLGPDGFVKGPRGLLPRQLGLQVLQQVDRLTTVHAVVRAILPPHDVDDELRGVLGHQSTGSRLAAKFAPLAGVGADVLAKGLLGDVDECAVARHGHRHILLVPALLLEPVVHCRCHLLEPSALSVGLTRPLHRLSLLLLLGTLLHCGRRR